MHKKRTFRAWDAAVDRAPEPSSIVTSPAVGVAAALCESGEGSAAGPPPPLPPLLPRLLPGILIRAIFGCKQKSTRDQIRQGGTIRGRGGGGRSSTTGPR